MQGPYQPPMPGAAYQPLPSGGQPPGQQYPAQQVQQAPAYSPQQPPQQYGAPPGYQPQQMAAQVPAAPQSYQVDEQAMINRLAQVDQEINTRRERGGGGFAQYLKFLGPQGQSKWNQGVPVGYICEMPLQICGPWAEGIQFPFVEFEGHFVRCASYPKGFMVTHTGDDCEFCRARTEGLKSTNPQVNEVANKWGRINRSYLYNVLNLANPQGHYYTEDGLMRPLILAARQTLQTDLSRIFNRRSIRQVIDYQTGRPVFVSKKKTGPEERDVEYGALDGDPKPLDPYFWPATYNLWDLTQEVKPTDPQIVHKVLTEIGLRVGGQVHQVPATYQAQAMPPQANPYAAGGQLPPPVPAQQPQVQQGYQQPPPMPQQQQQQAPAAAMPPPPQVSSGTPPANLPPPPPPGAGQPVGPGMPPPPPMAGAPAGNLPPPPPGGGVTQSM